MGSGRGMELQWKNHRFLGSNTLAIVSDELEFKVLLCLAPPFAMSSSVHARGRCHDPPYSRHDVVVG